MGRNGSASRSPTFAIGARVRVFWPTHPTHLFCLAKHVRAKEPSALAQDEQCCCHVLACHSVEKPSGKLVWLGPVGAYPETQREEEQL